MSARPLLTLVLTLAALLALATHAMPLPNQGAAGPSLHAAHVAEAAGATYPDQSAAAWSLIAAPDA